MKYQVQKAYNKVSDGYVTLISVLVLGAVGSLVTTSLILSGLSASRTSFSGEQSAQARALANACAEEGLIEVRLSTSYTGSGALSFTEGSCTFTVTSQGGQSRTITAVGTVGDVVRKVEVSISAINPDITAVWKEVSSF